MIMLKPQKSSQQTLSLLLFDGFSNLCLANAVEPLRAANMLAGQNLYHWEYCSLSGGQVTSSSGLPVQTARLSEQAVGAYLFVMPSYHHHAHATPATARALRAAARRFDLLVGLDTGSWLLAQAGLLDGHRATSHWDILGELAEAFPEVDVVEDRFVIDGARASCGGATTTLELMLHLIETRHSAALALEVAALFMYGERDPRCEPLFHLPPDRIVRAAAALMRRHVEAPIPIPQLAKQLGYSQRTLETHVQRLMRLTPAALYRKIRLSEVRRQIEQTRLSIGEISQRCGYENAAAMTRAFRQQYGAPPTALRKRIDNPSK